MSISNILICAIIVVIVIKIVDNYEYYTREDYNYITSETDFNNYINEGRYNDSKIFKEWNNLSECDKNFIKDLICHEMLLYKKKKPCFKKMARSAFRQIVITSILSVFLLSASFGKTLKQNSVGYFISNVI